MKTRHHLNSFRYNFMVAIFLLFLNFQGFEIASQASDVKIDSLRQVIARHSSDEEVVDALLAMANEHKAPFLNDSARFYADSALAISTRINYLEGIVSSNLLIINFQWLAGRLDEARASIPGLIQIAKDIKDDDKLGMAYLQAGIVNRLTGALDSAIYYFKSSLALELKDTLTIISDFDGLGSVFADQAEYDSAIYYRLQAASIAESSGNDENLGRIVGNIGHSFRMLGEYNEAEKYYKRGLEISRRYNNVFSAANILTELGILYSRQGNIYDALASLDESNEMFKSIGVTNRTDLYLEYALIYEKLEKYDLAVEYCRKSLEINKDENDVAWLMRSLIIFGHIYTKMGKHQIARAYLDSAITIAIEKGYRHDQMDLMKLRAMNSFTAGKFEKAYIEFGAFFNLYDSINAGKAKALTELKIKYEKEKDQAQILSLEKETLKKTLQRNLILFNSSALVVAALFLLMLLRHKLIKTKLLSQQKIQKLEEEKKIMLARNLVEGQEEERKRIAMELHDGLGVILSATKMQFSTLNGHASNDPRVMEKAIRLLDEAAVEVRRISHNMMPGLLTKLGLYEAIEDLFESINESEKLTASITIEGETDLRLPENIEIMLYRIIQEMVNNTLKYANASQVNLSISASDSEMILSYMDNGIGFDTGEVFKNGRKSLGLKSIESRVGFLNGKFTLKTEMGKGVDYLITIPL